MLFNSVSFLIYFPIVVLVCFIIPDRFKNIWLLIASYYFYMSWNAKYGLLILLSTVITYVCGIIIDRCGHHIWRKLSFALCLVSNFSILFFFKYFEWILENINQLFGRNDSLPFTILLPVGISFYTFQAVGYTFDVYRGRLKAEKNFIDYALFVSFFPQLVAGPIERSTNLLSQFKSPIRFDAGNVTKGLQIMLWGYVEKVVIADNLAILVDTVYGDYNAYSGSMLVLASALFAIQIYCDFGGYSHIAIGAAKVLGVTLMDNFRQPFFARSIREHWRRWHISLSGWFRDYLYIPLGGSRCSKGRKYLNVMITFLASGMWHGASWHYIIWGGLHGGYQVIGEMMTPLKKKIWELLHINPEHIVYQTLQRVITFFLIVITFVVFRANSFRESLEIFKIIVLRFEWSRLIDGSVMNLGLVPAQCLLVIVALILLLAVDILHERGFHFSLWISEKPRAVRWGVYYVLTFLILVSILQTFGQSASSFLYFQF